MLLSEVLLVVATLTTGGCRFWLEGGWGVDALVGTQTREHRDVDVDLLAEDEARAIALLGGLGYVVQTDWRPTRVELVAPGRGWVDLHPLDVTTAGGVRQAALDGGWHDYPPGCFTTGLLDGVPAPCVDAPTQRLFRTGYDLRDVDRHDLAQLDRLATDS